MDIGILAVAASTFAATNLDDFVGLTAFFAVDRAAGGRNTLRIWAGQLVGMGVLTAAAILAARAVASAPSSWVRWLALVPIVIGLTSLLRPAKDDDGASGRHSANSTLAVIAFTVANGGDNLALYVPLFHDLNAADGAAAVACFAALTVLWCALASFAGRAVWRPRGERRWRAGRVVPLAYIAVGLATLARSFL
ncbi:cadmium resistance transporter [Sinomonas sp. ASV322]|uniref:cadmium resistance transporter n=1 Tax=Sinomonas sp. ASV322 TaxID=3041920 RepID=UPI0027DBD46A|nr:cadmium resistance transporter [Sinomonas sp. ASV322]MDQ4502867.1 cadmium resistance transporter [Sinomonas sp. ASV322]